ncbi:MAG: hypothetical protein P8Z80_11450 [Pseudolabrys sp.]
MHLRGADPADHGGARRRRAEAGAQRGARVLGVDLRVLLPDEHWLYSAVEAAGVWRAIYIVVAVLAVVIGLFNLKDYLWCGKWFVMEVPLSWRQP